MKRLPPDSAGNFPRFKEGSVYIIIDPRSSIYQYRLHRTTLSRISPAFAKVLRKNCLEASEALKTEVTDAHARFDLIYSDKHGKWVLRRGVSWFLIRISVDNIWCFNFLLTLWLTTLSHSLYGSNQEPE